MSTISLVMFVLSVLFLIWQTILVAVAMSLVLGGRYSNVKIGLFPLFLSAGFCIAGIMLH